MTEIELRQECEFERYKLTSVELPNLIHKILRLSLVTKSKRKTEIIVAEIKKITNVECQLALEKFKDWNFYQCKAINREHIYDLISI